MSDEQKLIIKLSRAVGLALGSLETIRIAPYDFNGDGLVRVIEELRQVVKELESQSAAAGGLKNEICHCS